MTAAGRPQLAVVGAAGGGTHHQHQHQLPGASRTLPTVPPPLPLPLATPPQPLRLQLHALAPAAPLLCHPCDSTPAPSCPTPHHTHTSYRSIVVAMRPPPEAMRTSTPPSPLSRRASPCRRSTQATAVLSFTSRPSACHASVPVGLSGCQAGRWLGRERREGAATVAAHDPAAALYAAACKRQRRAQRRWAPPPPWLALHLTGRAGGCASLPA